MTDNILAYRSLGWILNHSQDGLYIVTASAGMQSVILTHYAEAKTAVYNFQAQEEYTFEKVSEWIGQETDARIYFLQNFQNALLKDPKAALRRLNFSRDMLADLGRNIVFCMTEEADTLLCKGAYDFYAYVSQVLVFQDELAEKETVFSHETGWRPMDESIGLTADTDWHQPREKLLADAICLVHQAKELAESFRYADARSLLQTASEIRERLLGSEHPDTAAVYYHMGDVYQIQGDYAKALTVYQKALDILEQVFGMMHPDTANVCNEMAETYQNQGDYKEALAYYTRTLDIHEKILGPKHLRTAGSYNNMAVISLHLCAYEKALNWCHKALDVYEKDPASEQTQLATVYHNIASACRCLHRDQEALSWYQKALEIRQNVLQPGHPHLAVTYSGMASLYQNMGDYTQAFSWQQKALAAREEVLGPAHPDTAITYHNMAVLYELRGDQETARDYYEKAYAIFREKLGEQNRFTNQIRLELTYLQSRYDGQKEQETAGKE